MVLNVHYIILNTDHVNLEWVLVDVANNSQRGTSERARKKMMKISAKARAAIDNKPLLSPQTNKRALSQEGVETEVREERQRAQKLERR